MNYKLTFNNLISIFSLNILPFTITKSILCFLAGPSELAKNMKSLTIVCLHPTVKHIAKFLF